MKRLLAAVGLVCLTLTNARAEILVNTPYNTDQTAAWGLSWTNGSTTDYPLGIGPGTLDSAVDHTTSIISTENSGISSSIRGIYNPLGGDSASIRYEFDENRLYGFTNSARTQGRFFFSTESDAAYSLSGLYELDGQPTMEWSFWLYDLTDNEYVFTQSEWAMGSTMADTTFTLGEVKSGLPDYLYNGSLQGSLEGTLTASHSYEFRILSEIRGSGVAQQSPITATGSVELQVGSTAVVPEPAGPAALLSLGLCGIVFGYRRRTRKGR